MGNNASRKKKSKIINQPGVPTPPKPTKLNSTPDALSALEKYWEKTQSSKSPLTRSQNNREIRICFNLYDFNKSGALEREEAICYVSDLLKVSRFDKKVRGEAERAGEEAEGYLERFVENIYRELDSEKTGKVVFEQLLKHGEWTELLRWVSVATLHEIQKTKTAQNNNNKKEKEKKEAEDDSLNEEKLEEEFFSDAPLKKENDTVLGQEDIVYLRQQKVKDVCDVLQVAKPVCLMLLNKFNWDVHKVIVAFSEDPEGMLSSIGYSEEKLSSKSESKQTGDKPKEIECSICFEDKEEYTILDGCGHKFCNDCWADNFTVSINEGKTFQITCMTTNCPELVPDEVVKTLVPADVWEKYVRFLSKDFIEGSKGVRWCPAPGCNAVIAEPSVEGDNMVGECTCGLIFCWYCKKMAHTPITCKEYSFWEEENPELGQALLNAWLYSHTKPCPTCGNYIEKNEGCFHMTCRCGYQFCWGCRKKWGTTNCNSGACNTYAGTQLTNKPIHHKDEGTWNDTDEKKFAFLEKVKEFFQAEELQKARDIPVKELINEIMKKDGLFSPKIINEARSAIAQCRRIQKCLAIKQYFTTDPAQVADITNLQASLGRLIEGLALKVEVEFLTKKKYDMKLMTAIQQTTNSVKALVHTCLNSDYHAEIPPEGEEKKEEEKKEEKKEEQTEKEKGKKSK